MTHAKTETRPLTGAGSPASQQVSWWSVHEFIAAVIEQVNHGALPTAGTPAWCELADGDPRKLLALAVAGEHHVLRVEAGQIAVAEASRCVASSAKWSELGRGRGARYIERRSA